MEVQSGAEVRRLHVVYFLSRKGLTEHPHLIRVHHHSNTGVRLHDIKRWLGDLRGTYMPESFAWSYKRRYKTGYIWQDLLDDDLVTPVSDNEFVLKGSEISCTGSEQETLMQKDQSSSETSTTALSSKIEESPPLTNVGLGHKLEPDQTETISGTLAVSNKNKNDKKPDGKSISTGGLASISDKPRPTMSFCNFITCVGVDTKDSAVVTRYDNLVSDQFRNARRRTRNHCSKGDSKSSCDGASESRQPRENKATYKPLNGPNCAQCGKPFKPEKLLAHMKSCKGTKILASDHANFSCVAENKSRISSTASRNRGSHFLSVFPKQSNDCLETFRLSMQ